MSRQSFLDTLEDVADNIDDFSRLQLAILFRRAALRLRNTDGLVLDPEVDDALSIIASESGELRPDLIRRIIREWLESNGYLIVRDLDEGSEAGGVTSI